MEFRLDHPDTGLKTILVIFDGVPYEADSDHPWWNEIIDLCLRDDPRVVDLFPKRTYQKPSEYFDAADVIPASREEVQAARERVEASVEREQAEAQVDPPFTQRDATGELRPRNDILVNHFTNRDYTLRNMAEAEGYTEEDAYRWLRNDPELHRLLGEALQAHEREREQAFVVAAPPERWTPHSVTIIDDDGETD